jgi:homoserine O-acetyltransferase/O-succinyltransferase
MGRTAQVAEIASPRFLRPLAAPAADAGQAIGFAASQPLTLDSGRVLSPFTVAFKTYGTLNAAKSNAVLICHALTGDQFAASRHPVTGKPGWWDLMIGPGKPIDTDRFFVVCPNVIGGCMGSTGPAEINPETGEPYGLGFPLITIRDTVRAQAMLLDVLGIERILCVLGGSMGGMQVLQWAASFPDRVVSAVPIAAAARHSAQNIAFHEVGRQAIMADPDWKGGSYQLHGTFPSKGLAVARMAAHITYLSETALQRKFGRALQNREAFSFAFRPDFRIESYLHYQGSSFVDRFDANSYLYITRAMDYFDLASDHGGVLAEAFRGTRTRFCIISFTSDWLFPSAENKHVAHALNAAAANVSFVEIKTDRGHDSFLLDEPEMFATVRGFLCSVAAQTGVR